MQSKVSELVGKINRIAGSSSFSETKKVELDLLMQHVRDLYDELHALRNGESVAKKTTEVVEPPKEKVSILASPDSNNENSLLKAEPAREESIVVKQESIPAKIEVKTGAAIKSSINEIVQTTESLNSKLKQPAKEIHHTLSNKPLKELIDLNKRFVIINELFGGSAEAFSKTVQQIDSLDDFAAAESFIHSQPATQYKWLDSSTTVRLFWKLVRQKFGVVHL